MAAGSDGRVGIAKETTFGTRVAPARFIPVTTHTKDFNFGRYFSPALGTGRNARPSVVTTKSGGTTLTGDVPTVGFGYLLDGLHGNTVTPVQQSATTAYLQTHTLDTPITKSFSIQDQMPPVSSSVLVPHDLTGCVMSGITISWDPAGVVSYEIPMVAQNLDLTQTLATYTPPAAYSLFPASGITGSASITIAAVAETNVLGSGSFAFSAPLRDDAYVLGGGGSIAKPVETDKPTYQITFTADFNDNVNITRVLNNTVADVVIKFEGAIIASTFKYMLQITVPDCVFTSSPPGLDGPGPVQQGITITAASSTGNSPVILYQTTGTTL